jgi:hypothetical protein
MRIDNNEMVTSLRNNQEVFVWACSFKEKFPPTFGKITNDYAFSDEVLNFHPIKKNNDGFLKKSFKESSLICFSTYEEAASYFNARVQSLVKETKETLLELEDLLVSPS